MYSHTHFNAAACTGVKHTTNCPQHTIHLEALQLLQMAKVSKLLTHKNVVDCRKVALQATNRNDPKNSRSSYRFCCFLEERQQHKKGINRRREDHAPVSMCKLESMAQIVPDSTVWPMNMDRGTSSTKALSSSSRSPFPSMPNKLNSPVCVWNGRPKMIIVPVRGCGRRNSLISSHAPGH